MEVFLFHTGWKCTHARSRKIYSKISKISNNSSRHWVAPWGSLVFGNRFYFLLLFGFSVNKCEKKVKFVKHLRSMQMARDLTTTFRLCSWPVRLTSVSFRCCWFGFDVYFHSFISLYELEIQFLRRIHTNLQ